MLSQAILYRPTLTKYSIILLTIIGNYPSRLLLSNFCVVIRLHILSGAARISLWGVLPGYGAVSYTHLDVYKRQVRV